MLPDGLLGLSTAGQQRGGRIGVGGGGVGAGAIGLVTTVGGLLSSAKYVNTQSTSKNLLSPNELCHAHRCRASTRYRYVSFSIPALSD